MEENKKTADLGLYFILFIQGSFFCPIPHPIPVHSDLLYFSDPCFLIELPHEPHELWKMASWY